jgi:acetyl esterase/lipase
MSISRKQFLKNAALLGVGSTVLKQNLFAKKPPATFSCTLTRFMDLRSNYPGIGNDIQMIEGPGILYGKTTDFYKDENFADDCQPTNSSSCDGSDALISYNGVTVKSYQYNLRYYVYYPNIDYSTCKLPASIVAHSGGFSDCSNINNTDGTDIRTICIEMAKRGYVCFSVEYRRGRIKSGGFVTVQQMLG